MADLQMRNKNYEQVEKVRFTYVDWSECVVVYIGVQRRLGINKTLQFFY